MNTASQANGEDEALCCKTINPTPIVLSATVGVRERLIISKMLELDCILSQVKES